MEGVTDTTEMVRVQGPVDSGISIDLPTVVLEQPITVDPPPQAPYDFSDESVDDYAPSPKGQCNDMDEDPACM
jgi:hypothetical protein